ncbi:hypothetical protein [Amycolatopsis sp. NPDC051903]|uniref:hypothetical protein n=1 Tax=Amycolatopsis sp. NPDC051903 TaxID=3363936 RepID=UPI00378B7F5F
MRDRSAAESTDLATTVALRQGWSLITTVEASRRRAAWVERALHAMPGWATEVCLLPVVVTR